MTLTKNERRALAEFKKKRVDWNKVHGKTLHSLQRKKLVESGGKGQSWRLTAAGLAELAVPDVFAELFVIHLVHIKPDLKSYQRGGSTRTAVCSCGWTGPQRATLELATDDGLEHERRWKDRR